MVGLAAVVAFPVLVVNIEEIELSAAQSFDADETVRVRECPRIDRIVVTVGIRRALPVDGFLNGRGSPLAVRKEGRPPRVVTLL